MLVAAMRSSAGSLKIQITDHRAAHVLVDLPHVQLVEKTAKVRMVVHRPRSERTNFATGRLRLVMTPPCAGRRSTTTGRCCRYSDTLILFFNLKLRCAICTNRASKRFERSTRRFRSNDGRRTRDQESDRNQPHEAALFLVGRTVKRRRGVALQLCEFHMPDRMLVI